MSTNVTVNGIPLEEHLSEQAGCEIAEVRAADERPVPRRNHAVTRRVRNHSNGRTAPGEVIYQAGQRETHVIVAGNLFPWQDKAPYVRSGHSLLGALEYDASADKVKCATCGEWFHEISIHVNRKRRSHGTMRDYRLRHGFRLHKSPLATPTVTAKRRMAKSKRVDLSNRPPADRSHVGACIRAVRQQRRILGVNEHSETFNLRAKCKAQRLQRLKEIAGDLGRCPTHKELQSLKEGLSPFVLRELFGVPMRQIFVQAGITSNKIGANVINPGAKRNIGPRLQNGWFISRTSRLRKNIGPLSRDGAFLSRTAMSQQRRLKEA